eukprot:Plantae.Rhodophyta-Purpureofilum_apyrenoidigerum.ctg20856.p1 GENE.Plantae.Rhodophyta-Purpureofilum_apyrenoidigerum.ctg20856~~Plantae.Rhodophyta-Purpureofilum_apyrenoidigerum.ctg20856.p1  ORF type:complete len:159 (+),score=29.56 Plantae.Rhodophyta-Purpureofilum_apyrenoidigerum.ctg20856:164-640(+)
MGVECLVVAGAGVLLGFVLGKRRREDQHFVDVDDDAVGYDGEEYKVVLCVRTDLGMKKGKMAAQCGHAALGIYKEALRKRPQKVRSWEANAQPKIALQIRSMQEARTLERMAKSKGIPSYMVYDAGRTQIASGSMTVLALGPARKDELDTITGKLKLL